LGRISRIAAAQRSSSPSTVAAIGTVIASLKSSGDSLIPTKWMQIMSFASVDVGAL
jgi:hypothetical protein